MDTKDVIQTITNRSFINTITIGNAGLVLITIYKQTYFLIAFAIGAAFNMFSNFVLKTTIKESRPNSIYGNHPIEKYGMPSGHVQYAVFCVTFLYLLRKSPYIIFLATAVALTVMFQRYFIKAHTLKQIAAGAAIGAFNAWLAFYCAKQAIIRGFN